jgi:phosphoglycolate phosphatase-like HAD superfamily hydrolase
MPWIRPGLVIEQPLESAIFDVDGVLIDTTRSYRLSVIAATDYLLREHLRLWPPAGAAEGRTAGVLTGKGGERTAGVLTGRGGADSPVTLEDVAAFKLAGGFNNDWYLTFALTGLWTARLREWQGQPEAALSLQDWAAQAQQAALRGQGGMPWARATIPLSAQIDYDLAQTVHDELYWGAALLRELLGREPTHCPDAPGLVQNEEVLAPSTLLPDLYQGGLRHFGLITGRLGPEVPWAIRLLSDTLLPPTPAWPLHSSAGAATPFEIIVPGDQIAKPDPAALVLVAERLGIRQGLFVGDTADDLALVLNYRRVADASRPPFLAVMIASGHDAQSYRERGADLVLSHIRELPGALAQLVHASQSARKQTRP